MEEPFDLTKFVDAFDLTVESGLWPQESEGENLVYTHEFKTDINIDLGIERISAEAVYKTLQGQQKHIMRMTQKGRFWFDSQLEADVIMTSLIIDKRTGEATATYHSMDIRDKTNYSKLARFLRWILRR